MEPAETADARQQLGKHIHMAMNTHTAIEKLLGAAFYTVCAIANTQYVMKGQ
jgi:hypothetical protein